LPAIDDIYTFHFFLFIETLIDAAAAPPPVVHAFASSPSFDY